MHKDLQRIAADAGLSRGEMLALGAIAAAGPPYETSPTELKAALWISLPGIGKRLDLLEARGLIRRQPNPNDRRGQRIRLTDRGIAALEATRLGSHIPSHLALAQMPPDQKIELERLLRLWQQAIADGPTG
jgi:DNA-binding MarR family transcriptional regulator